jgi:hypothetical protein
MRRRVHALALLVSIGPAAAMSACEAPPAAGCEPACATRAPACATCPAIAEALCVEGACVDLDDRDAAINADVSISRDLDGVVAVIIAVVGGADCAGLPPLATADGVLAGTRVDVSGGPFHPDLAFGEVPAGTVVIAADGLAADGTLLGRGCAVVDVVAGANDAGVLSVDPT